MTDLSLSNDLDRLGVRYESHAPLAPLTWYGLGGPAEALAHPVDPQQLSELAAHCHRVHLQPRVIGDGANLLVADEGVPGVVVSLDSPAFTRIRIEGTMVTAGAGANLPQLVLQTARAGLTGLECLAGIPASVGGAVRMNAGGVFGDISHAIQGITTCDDTGPIHQRKRKDLAFTYRQTNIPERYILEASFALSPDDPAKTLQRVKEIFRYKKDSQPLADRSAGCAFKNPPPHPAREPISAGCLIEQASLKGFRTGGAEVSHRHANFIVTHPGCTAGDVVRLLGHVQHVVHDRFGIRLEREVVTWP